MPVSKSIASYSDIKTVLDTALARGGLLYEVPDEKSAIRWRARANGYRVLLRRNAAAQNPIPGYVHSTPYDELVFRLNHNVVVIEKIAPLGQMRDLASAKLVESEAPKKIEEPVDDLLTAAADLVRRVGDL